MATSVSIGYAPLHSAGNPPVLPRPSLCCRYYGLTPHMWGPWSDSLPVCLFGLPLCADWNELSFAGLFWRYPDFQSFLRILKLRCLSLAPSHGRSQMFIQNCLTRHFVSAAGALTCTLDSPFLCLVIIYHTNVILSSVFVRFIQQIWPSGFLRFA